MEGAEELYGPPVVALGDLYIVHTGMCVTFDKECRQFSAGFEFIPNKIPTSGPLNYCDAIL